MHESDSHPDIICSLCNQRLTLLPTDTTTDEHGKAVHPECYLKQLTGKKPAPPSAA
ncbi:MAG: hypothetical protein WA628_22400 [Terriglobales bacterium]